VNGAEAGGYSFLLQIQPRIRKTPPELNDLQRLVIQLQMSPVRGFERDGDRSRVDASTDMRRTFSQSELWDFNLKSRSAVASNC
jgi:hypothetical protein